MPFNPSVFVQVVLLAVGILTFVSFLGYGLARLILPHAIRHLSWLFSPFFGIGLTVPLLEINAYFGRGAQSALLPLCIFAAALLVWSHLVPNPTRQIFHQFWPFVIGAFILLMLTSLPITTATRLLAIGENGDAISYAARIDYFVDHGIAPPPLTSFRPNDALIAANLGAKVRQGESLFLAVVCSILPLKAYQVFSIAINLWYALTVLSVMIVGVLLFDLPSRYALILFGLAGFNATLIWANYDDFLSQQMVMPLAVLYILFLSTGLNSTSLWKERTHCFACAALFLAVIYSVYPEILPILVLFSLTVLMFNPMPFIQRLRYVGWGLLMSVVSIASNPIGFYQMLQYLPIQSRSEALASPAARMVAGNIRYFPSLYEIVSLAPHNRLAPYGVSFGLRAAIWLCFLVILVVIAVGIVKSRQQRTLLAALVSPIFLLLIANYAWSFPYGYMKILTEGTIFIELAFVVSLYTFFQGRERPPLPVLPGSLVRLVVALSFTAHFVATLIVIGREIVTRQPLTPAIEELIQINQQLKPSDTVLIHDLPPGATQMWVLYFLHTPMITIPNIIEYYPSVDSNAVPDYLLIQKGSASDDVSLKIWAGTPAFETSRFALYPKHSEYQLAFRTQALARETPLPVNQIVRIDVSAEELRVRSASLTRSVRLVNEMTRKRVATPFEVIFLTDAGREIITPICAPNDGYTLDLTQGSATIQEIRAVLIRQMTATRLRAACSPIYPPVAVNSHYSLHRAAPFVVRWWGFLTSTTSSHGSRFVNSQPMLTHLRRV